MLEKVDTKKLTAGLIVLTFLVIAVGGLIRVSDAGESCPDWPTCFGTWGFDISPEEQDSRLIPDLRRFRILPTLPLGVSS